MGLFTPFKRHADAFTYTPRFFDPEKERREQRRRELTGRDSASDSAPYQPGQYVRTMREARKASSADRRGSGTPKMVILGFVVIGAMAAYMLYPRIVEAFSEARRGHDARPSTEEFDPYAPITIVPNDYSEE